jgi:spore germination cell wall hydrolase CwlJ-like protein
MQWLHAFSLVCEMVLNQKQRRKTWEVNKKIDRGFMPLEELDAVYMFDKVFASFSLLTRKNLHTKKNARQLTRTF